jgi:hypothetical protein
MSEDQRQEEIDEAKLLVCIPLRAVWSCCVDRVPVGGRGGEDEKEIQKTTKRNSGESSVEERRRGAKGTPLPPRSSAISPHSRASDQRGCGKRRAEEREIKAKVCPPLLS